MKLTHALAPLAVLALAGCTTTPQGGPKVGEKAEPFLAPDAQGQAVGLADYEGKVVVLDFWATWCGPCRKASPHVQTLTERYAGDDRVAVVGVHVDENYRRGTPQDYMAEHGYTFGLIPSGGSIAKQYGIRSIPQFVVIGADGSVIHRQTGFGSGDVDKFGAIIDGHLAEQG